MSFNRRVALWTLIIAALGVIAALLAVFWPSGSPAITGEIPGTGCVQVGANPTCIVNDVRDLSQQAGDNDELFKAEVAKRSTANPTGPGPWPYVVVDAAQLGLKIRSTNDATGTQIGSATNRLTLWVDCISTSTFDPEPPSGAGPAWLRVRWPNSKPTNQYFNSEPNQPDRGYAYAGHAIPYGHNGKIPTCT